MIIRGVVTGGNKIGRKIGFPTANIAVDGEFEFPDGVYAARVKIDGQVYRAMANLGVKPSVSDSGRRFLEVHIFDFSQDIYDKVIEVELLDFIRAETRFGSMEELRAQLEKDSEKVLKLL